MPSPKDPSTVVQPGPGNAPDGTVSASALNFNPAESANAALQAHITNPVGAHEDSAIATDSFGGLQRWSEVAGSVESALTTVFNGLNARAAVICDANPLATNADYVGSGALSSAISAATGKLIEIHLRPGTYDISSTTLNNVTIIGGGGFNSSFAPEQTRIQNTGGAINIGICNIIRNVRIASSGNLDVIGDGTVGYNTFENVALDIGGSIRFQCQYNRCSQFGASPTAANPIYLEDSGGRNVFERVLVGQMAVTAANGASAYHDIRIAQGTPKFAGHLLDVTGNEHVFNSLKTNFVGSVFGVVFNLAGNRNVFNGLKLEGSSPVALATITLSGSNNVIDGMELQSSTAPGNTFNITGTTNVLRGLSFRSLTSGNTLVSVQGIANRIDGISYSSVTMTSGQLLAVAGSANSVSNVYTLSGPTTSGTYFDVAGNGSSLTNVRVDSVPSTGVTNVIRLQGEALRVSNVHLNNLSGLTATLVRLQSAIGCVVEGVTATNLAVTSGAGFRLVDFAVNSLNCLVKDISVATSANMGTTSGLVNFSGCSDCTLDGLYLSNVATTTAINSPIVKGQTGTNSRCTVRNVVSAFTSYANNTLMIDVDQQFFDGLTIEKIRLDDQITGASAIKVRNSGAAAQSSSPAVVIQDSSLTNANTASGHTVWVENFGGRVVIQRCQISGSGNAMSPIKIDGSWNVVVRDCSITGSGAGAITASAPNSGATFQKCSFLGPGGGNSGTQLFNGYGFAATSVFPHSPLVIKDCIMQLNTRNNSPSATTNPNVFLGGSGTTVALNHGGIIVDGLVIQKAPFATFTNWHRSPVLTVDVQNQHINAQSSFKNITIDMENIPYTGDGSGSAVFAPSTPFNGSGTVVEFNGPDSLETRSRSSTVVQGLSVLRVPRNAGAGNRCIVMARGVLMSGLVLDAAAGTAASYNAAAVTLNNCILEGADFYQTTSIPAGFGHIYAEDNSIVRGVWMRNFAVAGAEQFGLVALDCSSLFDSHFDMPFGSHIPVSSPMFSLTGNANDDGCWMANNKIIYTHNATSAADVRVVIGTFGAGVRVSNNRIINRAEANAGGYSPSPGSSNGGGVLIDNSSDDAIIEGNYIQFEWATGNDIVSTITCSGEHSRILNNHITNTATTAFNAGGSVRIAVTSGLYANVSNNYVEGNNTGSRVLIDTTAAGSSIVMGNHVDNISGVGVINLAGSDKPTPSSSYNFTT